ncbi:MAG: tRNA (N(6)-L-threonylcarbamoyladenosine(37)-C(2))-methylthiotransferase [Candidatus Diapherotrites archaeon]|nr:tRNA (N(6)-L-threonylcarbamoyladenosine(37)-C(2))-methylthiotransferase [Candidatus Diapherotrites archaeon]
MQKLFFIEGYGCSLNHADTEQLTAFLESRNFKISKKPENANFVVINTCAVKEQTENRMLKRIRELWGIAQKNNSKLIVFGCLPKINPEKVSQISSQIIQIGPSLKELSQFLELGSTEFSPSLEQKKSNGFVSIIPIARGCLGNCSFCATRFARGALKSYPIKEICEKIDLEKKPVEFWLTAQDTACYGIDIGTSLPALLKEIFKSRKKFRVRIGMMNPHYAAKIMPRLLPLFSDKRLYRFFHIPVQSGSDKILEKMNRHYKRSQYLKLVRKIRSKLPDATISTDVIVGFPGETEKDFEQTLSLVKAVKPDIINISRFGARPKTKAAAMKGQLHGRVKKKRSRILTELQKKISIENKEKLVGSVQELFVSEKGPKGNFVGRSVSYKPVVIENDFLGEFVKVKITRAFPNFLVADLA